MGARFAVCWLKFATSFTCDSARVYRRRRERSHHHPSIEEEEDDFQITAATILRTASTGRECYDRFNLFYDPRLRKEYEWS
jgi:hypothetical protein